MNNNNNEYIQEQIKKVDEFLNELKQFSGHDFAIHLQILSWENRKKELLDKLNS